MLAHDVRQGLGDRRISQRFVLETALLEVGYSARSATELQRERTHPPIANMPIEHSAPRIEAQALQVQETLAGHRHHREPSIPDLLVAATAEMTGLVVLHLDKDFDLIASVTGQRVESLT